MSRHSQIAEIADEMDLVTLRERAIRRRDAQLRRAASVLAAEGREGRALDAAMPDAIAKRYATALETAKHHDADVLALTGIADRREAERRGSRSPRGRTYTPSAEHSYFGDLFAEAFPQHRDHAAACERLRRHGREVSREATGRTDEGVRALRGVRTSSPGSVQAEIRAMTTAAGSAGSLVTPMYLVDDFGVFRAYPPSFWGQSRKLVDPGYGTTAYLPAFTSSSDAGEQVAENAGVPDASPTAQYLSTNLVTMTGEIEVSQQLLDRAGPGPGFDDACQAQLMQDLSASIDSYFLTQAIAGAGTVTDSTSFSVPDLWGDLGKARAQALTTAGAKLQPTALFIPPDNYEYFTSQVDGSDRPLLTPTPAGASLSITPGPDDSPPWGYMGQRILSTPVFTDGNIPLSSAGYAQLVLAAMPEVFTLVTEPVLRVIPETFASTMTCVIQLYCLAGIIVRHSAACQVVTGAAFPASPSFA
jgi:hypothetical protein